MKPTSAPLAAPGTRRPRQSVEDYIIEFLGPGWIEDPRAREAAATAIMAHTCCSVLGSDQTVGSALGVSAASIRRYRACISPPPFTLMCRLWVMASKAAGRGPKGLNLLVALLQLDSLALEKRAASNAETGPTPGQDSRTILSQMVELTNLWFWRSAASSNGAS